MPKKALLVLYSYHNHNTEKIVNVIAKVLDADIKWSNEINPEEVKDHSTIREKLETKGYIALMNFSAKDLILIVFPDYLVELIRADLMQIPLKNAKTLL